MSKGTYTDECIRRQYEAPFVTNTSQYKIVTIDKYDKIIYFYIPNNDYDDDSHCYYAKYLMDVMLKLCKDNIQVYTNVHTIGVSGIILS